MKIIYWWKLRPFITHAAFSYLCLQGEIPSIKRLLLFQNLYFSWVQGSLYNRPIIRHYSYLLDCAEEEEDIICFSLFVITTYPKYFTQYMRLLHPLFVFKLSIAFIFCLYIEWHKWILLLYIFLPLACYLLQVFAYIILIMEELLKFSLQLFYCWSCMWLKWFYILLVLHFYNFFLLINLRQC